MKNGLSRVSVMAVSFSITIYTNCPSPITAKNYAYPDNLAIFHTSRECKKLERTLAQDVTTLSLYFPIWGLKLSHAETVTAAFHLYK